MDPDPDPAIFVINLQACQQKANLKNFFFAYHFLKVWYIYIIFKDKKSQKEVAKQ
jgi:hypothetical protein